MYKLDTPQGNEHDILLSVWERSVRATHRFVTENDIELFKNIIKEDRLFHQVDLVCVRSDDGTILGFMGIAGDSLDMIFVDAEWRKAGVGKMLVKHAIEILNVVRVDVNEQNEDALGFYQHFGFNVFSRSATDENGKPYPLLHMQRN
ncbi:MAG TPA: GNAT family N-acetyltransferase [Mucilaginibacter sp.]|jgi:putative acetyltransferase